RHHLVRSWYLAFLGRTANGVEEMGWVNLLQAGVKEEQVLSRILGDTVNHEFYDRAQTLVTSGSPDERFVQALYQVLLHRTASDAEVSSHLQGTVVPARRPQVVLDFLLGQEFRRDQFEGYYNALLHRPGDAGLVGWVASGLDLHGVRVAFESGSEFF